MTHQSIRDYLNYEPGSRPPTHAELARLLRDLDQAKAEQAEEVRLAYRAGNNLYAAIVEAVAPCFPEGSRDLDWDVLSATMRGMAQELLTLRAGQQVAHQHRQHLRELLIILAGAQDIPGQPDELREVFQKAAANLAELKARSAYVTELAVALYPGVTPIEALVWATLSIPGGAFDHVASLRHELNEIKRRVQVALMELEGSVRAGATAQKLVQELIACLP